MDAWSYASLVLPPQYYDTNQVPQLNTLQRNPSHILRPDNLISLKALAMDISPSCTKKLTPTSIILLSVCHYIHSVFDIYQTSTTI